MMILNMFHSAASAIRSALITPALHFFSQSSHSGPSVLDTLAQRHPNMAQSLKIPSSALSPSLKAAVNIKQAPALTSIPLKLPLLPQQGVNALCGFGDGVSGIPLSDISATKSYRDARGIGSCDTSSKSYTIAKTAGSLLGPIGRFGYVMKAKQIFKIFDGSKGATVALETAKKASNARNALRMEFRGGPTFYGKATNAVLNFFFGKPKTWEQAVARNVEKFGTIIPKEIAKSASRTNPYFNSLVAAGAAGSVAKIHSK